MKGRHSAFGSEIVILVTWSVGICMCYCTTIDGCSSLCCKEASWQTEILLIAMYE